MPPKREATPEELETYDEAAAWIEREKEAMPLDELLGNLANLRVLRVLWGEPRPCWPVEVARRARISRSTAHAALTRLHRCRIVERVAAWGSSRTFAYRLSRRSPLVKPLERLFHVEAGIYGGWMG
jgi:hypothetical protein